MEEIKFYIDESENSMEKAVEHTMVEFSKIRAGKAAPSMVEGVKVDYYGTQTLLNHLASITTSDAHTIVIKPFEKSVIPEIEKAIQNSGLGLNPQIEGEIVRINVPALTEDRRKELVKQVKTEGENGKVRIRNIRKDTNDLLKQLLKEGGSEDEIKDAEAKVQKLTDSFIGKIDALLNKKEEEIMTV